MAMSAFRRSASVDAKNKGGKGGKGAFYEKFNIPKTPAFAPVLLIRGGYEDKNPPQELIEVDPATGRPKPVINDYFKTKKHKRKVVGNGGKERYLDTVCSAGPNPYQPQPCAGCYEVDSGNKSVTTSEVFAFTIIHLHPYHMVPLLDKEKRTIVMKNDNSGPVMTFSECSGRTCNFCRVARNEAPVVQQGEQWPGWQANQFTTTFGHRRYLEIGKGHLSNFDGFDNSISSVCGNPACGNQLSTEGWQCPHCKQNCITMDSSEARSDAEILEAVMKPYPCLHCRRNVLLSEVVCCEVCDQMGRKFVQNSIFNSVLFLFKQGEGTKTQVMMQRSMPIEQFGQQLGAWLPEGKTIYNLIEEIGKPYEFSENIFAIPTPEEQRKRLELNGTSGPQQPAPGAYGQAPNPYNQVQQMAYPQQQQVQNYAPPVQGSVVPQMQPQQPQQQFMAPQQPAMVQQQAPAAYGAYPQQGNAGPMPAAPAPRTNFGT